MKIEAGKALLVAVSLALPAADAAADAVVYGKANASIDYVDAEADAAWRGFSLGMSHDF